MPQQVLGELQVNEQALDDLYLTAPTSDGLAMREIAKDAQLTDKLIGTGRAIAKDRPDLFSQPMHEGGAVGPRLPDEIPKDLTADEANLQFGIPGLLSFEGPVGPGTAAFQHRQARQRGFRDEVLARSDINGLQAFGAAMAGALVDPAGLPLVFAPEVAGIRGMAESGLASRAAARAGSTTVRAGRLANAGRGAVAGGVEGLASGVLYEGVNYGLRHYAGEEDYTLGDSLANIVLGAGLGSVFGAGFGALSGGSLPARLPRVVETLDEDSRLGAVAMSLENVIEDEPVRVGDLIERQQARSAPDRQALASLDEFTAETTISLRPLEADLAVTTRGSEVRVRYALAELDDLVTSHTDDLEVDPAFPPELQPRQRERAGAQARNYQLESELNPKRLMRETGAESGAPIIAPDGTVESGNGRTIALRRSARTGSDAYGRYKAELKAQGFETDGMRQPVLVRVRDEPMTGERRAQLTREMNADVTERMSPGEQAMADAAEVDDATLAALSDPAVQQQRDGGRRFLARVAKDQINALVDGAGNLSVSGSTRVKAALVARAFGDQRLVETLFEAADNSIKAIGQALAEAAPAWAAMRAGVARGEIPADMDLTANLRGAVDLVRWARDEGRKVHEVIADRLGQTDMFTGEAISPGTEAFLRLFFRDEAFRSPRAAAKVAEGLREYARLASDVTPGPNLFGEVPDAGSAVEILGRLNEIFAREAEPAGVAGAGLFDPVEPRQRTGSAVRPEGGEGPGAGGEAVGVAEAPAKAEAAPKPDDAKMPKIDAAAIIAADPELKAMVEDTDAFLALLDEAPEDLARDNPDIIAEAVRAAAFCLKEG